MLGYNILSELTISDDDPPSQQLGGSGRVAQLIELGEKLLQYQY